MKIDASLPPTVLKDVPALAAAAEELGFDALWTTETQHDPFLPCALIAEHTREMKFGTAIAVSFARSPGTLAYTAWDLAAQSGGRFILGLGTQVKGHIEQRFGSPWPESVTGKLRDQIRALRTLWDCWQYGTKLNYRSEYYKLTLMTPFFNPGPLPFLASNRPTEQDANGGFQSLIPIYIAGVNPGLARLSGEVCEGFLVHPFHSAGYLREIILPAIRKGAEKSKRKMAEVAVSVTAFVATNAEEADFARSQIAFYASTPSYRPVMEIHGWRQAAEKLSAHAARGEWSEIPALITDQMLEEFCLVTDETNLVSALAAKYNGLADRLTVYNPFIPGERDKFWKRLVQNK